MVAVCLVLLVLPTIPGFGLVTLAGCIAAIVLAAIAMRRERAPLLPAIALGAAGAVLVGDLFYLIRTILSVLRVEPSTRS